MRSSSASSRTIVADSLPVEQRRLQCALFMAPKRDYYDVLGIGRTASPDEIKRAFRKYALECHPDRNPGDAAAEARFKELSEAYAILSDDEKRRRYDRMGHAAFQTASGGNAYEK